MALLRCLTPFVVVLLTTAGSWSPAKAQDMDTIVRILTDVLSERARGTGREDQARLELEAELSRIEDERQRLAESFDRRRAQVDRRYGRRIERLERQTRHQGDRRRRIREIERQWDDELDRLYEEEDRRMAELDRRQDEAERRYSERVYYEDSGRDPQQVGDIWRVIDITLNR